MQTYTTKLGTSSTEPVDLLSMIGFLRLAPGVDDQAVLDLITSARSFAEDYQRRSLLPQQWRVRLDGFPYFSAALWGLFWSDTEFIQSPYLPTGLLHPDLRQVGIELPYGPLISIDAFSYVDTAGVTQTVLPATYSVVSAKDSNPYLFPAGNVWPLAQISAAPVTIDFTAGGCAEHTKTALKIIVRDWYDNRGATDDIPGAAKRLLQLNTVYEF